MFKDAADFFANASLYESVDVLEYLPEGSYSFHILAALRELRFVTYCSNCEERHAFVRVDDADNAQVAYHEEFSPKGQIPSPSQPRVFAFFFRCANCSADFRCWVEFTPDEEMSVDFVRFRKVGQIPSPSVYLSAELRKALGKQEGHFRRGRICIGNGFGIAACTYFRRVLEGYLDDLLDILEEMAEIDSEPADRISKIRDTKTFTPGETKIKEVDSLVPQDVRVSNDNTLLVIYKALSSGLHSGTEESSLTIARTADGVLSQISLALYRAIERRRANTKLAENLSGLRKLIE